MLVASPIAITTDYLQPTLALIAKGGGIISYEKMVSNENEPLQELLMGVFDPPTPKKINAAAPDGAPARRIKTVEIIICPFSWLWWELPSMPVSTEPSFLKKEPYQGRFPSPEHSR
jgi:hypothetical protein